jgi:hypothetical protein
MMDTNFLKAHADRCRSLAETADEFTKRRLLHLAALYWSGADDIAPSEPGTGLQSGTRAGGAALHKPIVQRPS